MSDRRFDVRRTMVSHATRKLVADGDTAAANEIRVIQRDSALF